LDGAAIQSQRLTDLFNGNKAFLKIQKPQQVDISLEGVSKKWIKAFHNPSSVLKVSLCTRFSYDSTKNVIFLQMKSAFFCLLFAAKPSILFSDKDSLSSLLKDFCKESSAEIKERKR
jgi:hypothetical protein